MEEPRWWPSGIAQQSMDDALSSGELRTSFGRVHLWDPCEALTAAWWNNPPGNGVHWGIWPTQVQDVKVVSEDKFGILVALDGDFVARICPFLVGEDVSRMARYEPWASSVKSLPLLLPIGGWNAGNHDRVLIYETYSTSPIAQDLDSLKELVSTMSALHSALAAFETPNTERLWNERLKAMEDELKPHTLWRAPHTSATVGLPGLNLDLEHTVAGETNSSWIAMPHGLADHLVCQNDRLPSLAMLMRIERQWTTHRELDTEGRKSLLEVWATHTPTPWSKGKALSTALGGAWVWRYNAVLEQLLMARTYGDEALEQRSLDWLGEVSRLQARLGSLRTWKSGFWVAVTGVLVAYFGEDWGTFTSTGALLIAAGSIAFGVVTNRIYWLKDPLPY